MAQYQRFEDLIAWQKSKGLAVMVYKNMKGCSDRGYREQLQRAVVSIMNNIAEGFERKTDKEYKQFLYVAKGSSGEVRSMLILGRELGYLQENETIEMKTLSEKISRILAGLIKAI
jgi:four helix bundle protein